MQADSSLEFGGSLETCRYQCIFRASAHLVLTCLGAFTKSRRSSCSNCLTMVQTCLALKFKLCKEVVCKLCKLYKAVIRWAKSKTDLNMIWMEESGRVQRASKMSLFTLLRHSMKQVNSMLVFFFVGFVSFNIFHHSSLHGQRSPVLLSGDSLLTKITSCWIARTGSTIHRKHYKTKHISCSTNSFNM